MVIFPGVCIYSYNPPTTYEPANEPETYNAGTHATSTVEIVMLEKPDCVLSKRATRPYIIHISIWNVSFSILIGQNSVAEWLSG
jgi:hypothetical protein